jgi:hypothetical protein
MTSAYGLGPLATHSRKSSTSALLSTLIILHILAPRRAICQNTEQDREGPGKQGWLTGP